MLDFAVTRQSEPSAEVGAVAPSRLSLTFSCDGGGRTYLDRQFASYPFHVCRPHYFPHDAPGMATLYLQSSAGGLYQEDAHDIEIAANDGACAHVTTQASTIVHSMERGGATLRTTIAVGPGCHVEAVPDALILFPDARLTTGLTVRVHESATAIVGESFLMHDPDASDPNTDIGSFAAYKANTVVEDWDGARVAADRFRISARDVLAATPGITGGTRAQGLLMVLQRGKKSAAAYRESARRTHPARRRSRGSIRNAQPCRRLGADARTRWPYAPCRDARRLGLGQRIPHRRAPRAPPEVIRGLFKTCSGLMTAPVRTPGSSLQSRHLLP